MIVSFGTESYNATPAALRDAYLTRPRASLNGVRSGLGSFAGTFPGTNENDWGHPNENRARHDIRNWLSTHAPTSYLSDGETSVLVEFIYGSEQGISVAANAANSALQTSLSFLSTELRTFVKNAIGASEDVMNVVWEFILWMKEVANTVGAALIKGNFKNAFAALDITSANSIFYHLFMSDDYADLANAIAILILAPVLAPFTLINGSPVFILDVLDPTKPLLQIFRDVMAIIHDRPSGLTLVNRLEQFAHDFCYVLFGAGVSPPTALQLAVCVIGGLPNPNPLIVLPLIINDPIFRSDLKRRVGNWLPTSTTSAIVDGGLPAIVNCINVVDPNTFFNCAEQVINATMPGLVANLRKRGVPLHDARIVVQQLWKSNGDPSLAFDQSTLDGQNATNALMTVGVGGLVCMADLIGEKQITKYLSTYIGPIVPANVYANLLKGVKFTKLLIKVFTQYDPENISVAWDSAPDTLSGCLEDLNTARWDLGNAFALMRAKGRFNQFLNQNGTPIQMTPELKALLVELANDHTFDKIGRVFCDLFSLAGINTSYCPPAANTLSLTDIKALQAKTNTQTQIGTQGITAGTESNTGLYAGIALILAAALL